MEKHIAFAVKKLLEDPKVRLMAEANHLDNFTLANAMTAYEHLTDSLGIHCHYDNMDLFNALCDECYVKYRHYAVGSLDRHFTPSASKTCQEVCKQVYEKVRYKNEVH